LQCLLAALWLAAYTTVFVSRVAAVQFDQRQPSPYSDDYYDQYGGGPTAAAAAAASAASDEESPRTHHLHKKLKLKKLLKKKLLLQCLLGHGRRRRDASEASGRFLFPVVLQSTNVNVGSGGGHGGQQQQSQHGGGCMQMFGDDNHGPLGSPPSLPSLGSLGSPLGSLGSALGSFGPAAVTEEQSEDEGGNRNGQSFLAADWNRYARQFRRNFVRPLYRLF